MTAGLSLLVGIPYFYLQRRFYFPVTVMKPGPIEGVIPFQDEMVWIYQSLYLLILSGPYLMTDRRELRRFSMGLIAISLVSDAFFFAFPTTVLRPSPENANALYRLLISYDAPFNAFPSLHISLAVYSAAWAARTMQGEGSKLGWRLFLSAWLGIICFSTLATKQHVLLDVAGGLFLGALTSWIVLRRSQAGNAVVINALDHTVIKVEEETHENEGSVGGVRHSRVGSGGRSSKNGRKA